MMMMILTQPQQQAATEMQHSCNDRSHVLRCTAGIIASACFTTTRSTAATDTKRTHAVSAAQARPNIQQQHAFNVRRIALPAGTPLLP
jgi:hypothetical protein